MAIREEESKRCEQERNYSCYALLPAIGILVSGGGYYYYFYLRKPTDEKEKEKPKNSNLEDFLINK